MLLLLYDVNEKTSTRVRIFPPGRSQIYCRSFPHSERSSPPTVVPDQDQRVILSNHLSAVFPEFLLLVLPHPVMQLPHLLNSRTSY